MEEVVEQVLREAIRESRKELPFALTVNDLENLLPFGKTKIYEMLRQDIIPNKKVSGRIVVARDKFLVWFYDSQDVRSEDQVLRDIGVI
ncbi:MULTISPECIES: hypothetical protein [unclassified Candidatus Frackibacter]|uniref:hypothetical protein n=1 Tax=unclassified Candidatus Frackibacter TaxID=2648818 RepID=UPI00088BDECC|nr:MULTISPECIES: hypothetical protein [unclassified Candidatus Frackibacter]SDC31657.1 hypothetical protein SAMN04515661_106105 [Candidatus Frackibacter sp. WG11]SEM73197.1 hypothetical protein SAMN04488698_11412 [Candidatus Frackibacter sp. WG12]SFL59498.1 hypothetical protein SAMN04488699_106104 [Candidatus Frackibacter sp. WG13]